MDEADRERVEALLRERADDTASELHEKELDVTTDILFDEEERRFAEARQALDKGTYGVCVGCGTEIPPARLKAVPEAVRCFSCQREFEAVHRQSVNGQ